MKWLRLRDKIEITVVAFLLAVLFYLAWSCALDALSWYRLPK